MPDAYDLHEGRFIQHRGATSAANDDTVFIAAVPAGKVWTVLSAYGVPNVDETQGYWFGIMIAGLANYPITRPVDHTFDVSAGNFMPCVTEGMEIKLFPGEQLSFNRDAHTAGSTITIQARLIETDLPPYDYIEPQERKRITALKHSVAKAMSGSVASGGISGGGITPPGARGGGRGGSEPY